MLEAKFAEQARLRKLTFQLSDLLKQRIAPDEIAQFSDLELTKEQERKLKSTVKEFSLAIKEIDQAKPHETQKLKMRFVRKLNEFLLPEQIVSLSESKSVGFNNVLRFLSSEAGKRFLKLSDFQSRQIDSKIEIAESNFQKALEEYNRIVERQRKSTLDVFSQLNEDQAKKLNKMLGGEPSKLLEKSDLPYLRILLPSSSK